MQVADPPAPEPPVIARRAGGRARGVRTTRKLTRCLSIGSTNALDHFGVLEELLATRRLVLLLDYDGTLTPIVNDPKKALLSEEVRETLRELPKHYVTGIVTGRSLAKIRTFVNVPGLFYAGSHGFDILAPGCSPEGQHPSPDAADGVQSREISTGALPAAHTIVVAAAGEAVETTQVEVDAQVQRSVSSSPLRQNGLGNINEARGVQLPSDASEGGTVEVRYQVAGEFLPVLQQMRQELEEAVRDITGAEVEDNMYSISVHYRNCDRSDVPRIEEIVQQVQSSKSGIRLRNGKEVFELQPDVQWNKGSAVVWMLDMLGLSRHSKADATSFQIAEREDAQAGSSCGDGDAATGATATAAALEEPEEASLVDSDGDDDASPHGEVFTIFIGDDRTDEDAFRVFSAAGNCKKGQQPGLGILVSEESRDTHAAYTLRNPDEVAELLQRLVQVGETRNLRPVRVCAEVPARGDGGGGEGVHVTPAQLLQSNGDAQQQQEQH
eukprot:TRINITY_DN1999_c0_g1_i1.p1 TRINITY_DN1999_c0_g1~~TRINITY_DN1999_c0_g1_i1.p1  ORF type:complete len:497 (+),score=121.49 TRINITY_DN1999_c0_g1_i1:97-1587(+)